MHYILFTTTVCPKCPAFKDLIENQTTLEGMILNEQNSEFATLVSKYGLSQAPTLLIFDENDQIQLQTSDYAEADKFLQTLEPASV